MAKPSPTLKEMEAALGYSVDSTTDLSHSVYSDLTPVPNTTLGRTSVEYRELGKMRSSKFDLQRAGLAHSAVNTSVEARLLKNIQDLPGPPRTILGDSNTITIQPSHLNGLYKYFIIIEFHQNLRLSLLATELEADSVLNTALALRQASVTDTGTGYDSRLSSVPDRAQNVSNIDNIPREIRDHIYSIVFRGSRWDFNGWSFNICQMIGDPSGLLFPLEGDGFALLRASRKIREEALPFAYRHTRFQLGDIEDLVRFLLAIGQIGRGNIESLQFAWESAVDLDSNWRQYPDYPEC